MKRKTNVLVVCTRQLPERLLLMLQSIFDQVNVRNIDTKVLLTCPILNDIDYLLIDNSAMAATTDKQQLVLLLNLPTLFIDFNNQQRPDEMEKNYCWINWPCEISGLKNQLAFTQYKHKSATNKLVKENNLLKSTLSCVGNILVYLDAQGNTLGCNQDAVQLFAFEPQAFIGKPWYYWLQVKRDLAQQQTQQFITAAIKAKAVTKIQPLALNSFKQESILVDGIIGPIEYGAGKVGAVFILRKLAQLDNVAKILAASDGPEIGQDNKTSNDIVLITPDNFSWVNQQYDWLTGNRVLDEIEQKIRDTIRSTDISVRYSGASFLVLLYDIQPAQTHNILSQLMDIVGKTVYSAHKIALTFSFGVALNSELIGYSVIELFYFANFALSQAKELGGNQSRQWTQQNTLQQIGNFDRVNGSFLGKGTADYQKMLKFWILLNELGNFDSKKSFIQALLSQLKASFELDKVAFLEPVKSELCLLYGLGKGNKALNRQEVELSVHQKSYLEQVVNSTEPVKAFTSLLQQTGIEVLVPIKIAGQLAGCIKLVNQDQDGVALRDHHLLNKIASHVAATIENIERESKGLCEQDNLFSNGRNFWYSSNEMRRTMQEISMVAPTSATVLITGESGTGKEMLAKTIHQMSDRKTKPFVIFDCGAVVESLIESELFGHIKGAFTGAGKNADGCILQAQGGTLFLDEVGELPLHIQVKLLRFVQEKQYSQVGSTSYHAADVRVVTATNVDLNKKIAKGLFREDLYYRLNVFNIESPPLRKRQGDIGLIAENYLSKYSVEYGKSPLALTSEAKQAMAEYNWPGNIRELKNLIHRASILCNGKVIGCSHLGLYPASKLAVVTQTQALPGSDKERHDCLANKGSIEGHVECLDECLDECQYDYKNSLGTTERRQLTLHGVALSPLWQQLVKGFMTLLSSHGIANMSLLFFFEKELYNITLTQSHHITLQAAARLNIAESTFRRRWKILQSDTTELPEYIAIKVASLARAVLSMVTDESKITLVQHHLINTCVNLGVTSKIGGKLFNISLPTYRNLVRKLVVNS
jgi:hydrogenase-4 transcriptional activator